jgi:hypothetical protein
MEYLAQVKDILKILSGIMALSVTPESLLKGLIAFGILFIAYTMWSLLREVRGQRESQAELTKEVCRLAVDTNFLVAKHCTNFDKDAFELMKLREQGNGAAGK